MKNKIFLTLILCSIFPILVLNAQEGIPATGGDAEGVGGIVGYSIGQLFYTQSNSGSGSVQPGLQQSIEIEVVSSIGNTDMIRLSVSAFPNPVSKNLTLKIDSQAIFKSKSFEYRLYDINGKLILSKQIKSTETGIKMGSLKSAIYFLKLIQENRTIKTFKIIKR